MDDAMLMELMDHCEASGDNQHEQQDTATPTHIQQTEPEQAGTTPKNPPQSENSQEWNKPTIQATEQEPEGCVTQQGGEEKSQEEQEDEGEQEGGYVLPEKNESGVWGQRVCHTHERAVPMQDTVDELDITEEGMELTMI